MDEKVIKLVKSVLKKLTDKERKLFLRLLSEELAKELVRRRRLRKQEKDPASKIIEILKEDIRFDWSDFWGIDYDCDLEKEGSQCPVWEYLEVRHPNTVAPEDGMDFVDKIDVDFWVNYLEPEDLKEFLENEGVQNKVYRALYNLMWDKLEDAVNEIKDDLEEIEERVDQDIEAVTEGWGEDVKTHLHDISTKLDNLVDTGPQDSEVEFFFNKLKDYLKGVYNRMKEGWEE